MIKKYYAVRNTKTIYNDWETCKIEISKIDKPIYKSFLTYEEADAFNNFADILDDAELADTDEHSDAPKKYYAVRNTKSIYTDWDICKKEISKIDKPIYKSFFTKEEAEAFNNITDSAKKFYAVRNTKSIYTDWISCKKAIVRIENPIFKSFLTREEAQAYNNITDQSKLTQTKYYAVKNTKSIYDDWETCRSEISSIENPIYKSFLTREEALAFINTTDNTSKFYAVRNTKSIYTDWPTCKKAITKIENPIYKSFLTREEAQAFNDVSDISEDVIKKYLDNGIDVAYVDGSFNETTEIYGSGAVLFQGSLKYQEFFFDGNVDEFKSARNIAGEVMSLLKALELTLNANRNKIAIFYDYTGLENWYMEKWRTNTPIAKYLVGEKAKYYKISVTFVKVPAHSNNKYNDLADKLAKRAVGI